MKRLSFPFSLLCQLALYLSFSVSGKEQLIDVKAVSSEPYIKVIERTGKLGFKRTVNLSFKTAGYLDNLYVDEGGSFNKNQVLAELDTYELVTEKNASYARLLQAKNEVQRIESLLAKKLSSRQALDSAKTLVETTRSSYKIAQYNIEKAQLIAPFDGVVLTRQSELAELQSPSKTALQIAAINNNVVVRVALTADEVSLVKLNQQAQISYSGGMLTGTISKIPLLNSSLSQLYTIEIFLAGIGVKDITVGQIAKVAINIDNKRNVYRLPISALNSINHQGNALVTVQFSDKNNQQTYQQQAYVIEQLSNDFIYLASEQNALPLMVVVQGWQLLEQLSKGSLPADNNHVNENKVKTENFN